LLKEIHMPFSSLFKPNITRMKEKKDIPGLIKALQHEETGLAYSAAKALGELNDSRAIGALNQALRDTRSLMREEAAKSLDSLGWKPSSEADTASWRIAKQNSDHGMDAVEFLIADLESSNDNRIRRWAVKELVQCGDQRAVEGMIPLLQDEDGFIRQEAAKFFQRTPDPRAVEPLISALMDNDMWVRYAVAEALGKAKNPSAITPLAKVITTDPTAEARRQAVHALAEIGTAEAIDMVIQCLSGGSEAQFAAVQALKKIGDDRAVMALIQALEKGSGSELEIARALAEIGDPRAASPLVELYRTHPHRSGSAFFAHLGMAIEQLGAPAIDPLERLLKDPNSLSAYMQECASNVLMNIKAKKS
jgi:HEAT repeat protein